MKNILILILLTFIFSLPMPAQSSLRSLENWNGEIEQGAYYKDLNNVMDNFEGTWLYTNGTTSLKIILVKKTMFFDEEYYEQYYEDLMIGEYQYIENGIEKINTLSLLNQNLGYGHKIKGNTILKNCYSMPEDDCIEGEKRVRLSLSHDVTLHSAVMILKRRVINGRQAIKAFIFFSYGGYDYPVPDPTLPWQQEYVMFKQ